MNCRSTSGARRSTSAGRSVSGSRRVLGLTNARVSSVEHGELRGSDVVAVREQLGREPTIPFTVVARCTGGHPLVIRNAPLDADGSPFPTTYWLTRPDPVPDLSLLADDGATRRRKYGYTAHT